MAAFGEQLAKRPWLAVANKLLGWDTVEGKDRNWNGNLEAEC